MKTILFTSVLLITSQWLYGQINAITETGEAVILYDDGTWKYLNEDEAPVSKIAVNEKIFLKDDNSTFLVKSKNINVGVWINPKVWKFSKGGVNNEDAEFEFELIGEDLYALLITEKAKIPVEALKNIALENAKGAAPDTRIVKEEYRTVNGKKLLMMHMSGTMYGMKISYMGYYYSNANGSLQLLAYTTTELLDQYQDEVELLLNGLVEL